MNRKTLTALRGSIEKWEQIAAGTGADKGPDNCPLCALFNNDDTDDADTCRKCPVFLRTDRLWCEDTPYLAFAQLREPDLAGIQWDDGRSAVSDKAKAAALAMKQFLESLLPKKERQP